MNKARSEEKVVMEYRGRVKQGREQFRKELESIVPDVKIGPRLDGMSAVPVRYFVTVWMPWG